MAFLYVAPRNMTSPFCGARQTKTSEPDHIACFVDRLAVPMVTTKPAWLPRAKQLKFEAIQSDEYE